MPVTEGQQANLLPTDRAVQNAAPRTGLMPLSNLIKATRFVGANEPERRKELVLLNIVRATLPDSLQSHCTAVTDQGTTAVIYCDSPLYSFQARFLSDDIVCSLRAQGFPNITTALIKTALMDGGKTRKVPPISVPSANVSECLKHSALSSTHAPLAEALLRLKSTLDAMRSD